MMNPFSWRRQSRLGRVSMEWFWATGWYAEVDRTIVDNLNYGKRDGCAHARNTQKLPSEFCSAPG